LVWTDEDATAVTKKRTGTPRSRRGRRCGWTRTHEVDEEEDGDAGADGHGALVEVIFRRRRRCEL
jgi:hypothetical protein